MSGYGGGAGGLTPADVTTLTAAIPSAATGGALGQGGSVTVVSPTSAGAYSAWTTVFASLSAAVKGLAIIAQRLSADGAGTTYLAFKIATGAGGAEVLVMGPIVFLEGSGQNVWNIPLFIPVSIPAGRRVSIAVANLTTASGHEIQFGVSTLV